MRRQDPTTTRPALPLLRGRWNLAVRGTGHEALGHAPAERKGEPCRSPIPLLVVLAVVIVIGGLVGAGRPTRLATAYARETCPELPTDTLRFPVPEGQTRRRRVTRVEKREGFSAP
jgi:hypothetical protein